MEETKYKTDPKLFFEMLRALTPIPDVTRVKKAEEFVSLAKHFSEKYGIESEIKKESAQISVWLYFRTQKQRFVSTMKEDFAHLMGMADNMLIIPHPRNKADSYDYALVFDLATHRIFFKGQDFSSI